MALGVEAAIADALLAHLGTLPGGLPIAMPGVGFSPPPAPYLAATHLPNDVTQAALGDAGPNRHTGLFQVSVRWPTSAGEGVVAPLNVADAVAAHFRRGTVIPAGGLYIRVNRPPRAAPPLVEAGSVQIPVTVEWVCDAPNPD